MAKKIENIVNEVVRTSEKVAQQSVKKARTNAQRKKQSAKSRTRSSSSGGIKDNAIIRRIGDTRQGTQNFLKNAIEETADSARRMMAVKSDDLVKAYNEKVNFSASDGTTFGPIRRGIYAKLVNFADDSKFDFESEEERNAVEAYKKYPGIDFELGGKNYKVTYNGYKAIANNTWDKYKPEESEKDAFNAIKSYPIYDLVTKDEKGNDKNWGKISYNGMQSLQNKKEYSSAFEDETKTINSYNTATGNIPAKSYDEIYEAAKYRIIEKAKANPSAQFEINPMSGNEDLAYYYQFITPSEREKIWQEFDEEFQKSVKTTSERNQYKALLKEREQALTSEYSDTKNTKKKNDEISTLVNTLTKTEGNFDKGFKTTLKVNQIEKILKEGEKINSEYKKIADKSNANDKYAPKNNSENKGYNLESKNRDEVYNMINLYSAGKLNEVNSFSINGIDVKKAWMYMEPAEISTYNKLYATDPKMAEKYLDELDDVLRIRMSNAIATQAREEGKKHPFLAAGLSLVGNMQNSGESALDTFVADITGDTAGYSDASIALRQAQNWRAGGAEKVTEKYGKAAGWAYNTGLSITENAITIAVTKGVGTAAGLSGKTIGAATTLSMATNAASNEMISIADRGGTARQMTMGGIAAGLFEYLFEKVPVDKIVSIRGGSVVKNMLGSALAEIPSEMGTEVANIISDSIIMGTNSENSLRRQQLVAEGMSAEEATKQVLRENLDQVLQAGASGGVSGGVMGGGATIINNATYNGEMKPIAEEIISTPKAIDKVIKLGEDLGVTEAKVVSEAVAKGETPTTKQVRKLTDAVVKKSIEKDASLPNIIKTIATIEGRKSDYYTSQEAIDTARAVYRTVAGTATETDKTLVARSDGARSIILASANTIGIDGEDSKEVTAWTALKTEAEKRSAEYGVRSENPSDGRSKPLPYDNGTNVGTSELYSGGKKVAIEKSEKKAGNIILNDESKAFRKKDSVGYKAISTMAKDLGMNVKYVKGLTDGEGNDLDGVITSEGIFINTESENPTRWAATHEFSHRMKQTGGKSWQVYQNYVISKLKQSGKYEERYNAKKGAYAAEAIDEEIAADYIGEMFEDVKELAVFIRNNRSGAVKVRDLWYKILDKFGMLDEKIKAKAMWAKAYKEAMNNSGVEYEDGAKFSIQRIVGENGDYGIGVYLDSDILTGLSETERIEAVKKYVKSIGGREFIAYDKSGNSTPIRIAKHSERYKNKKGNSVRVTKDLTSYLKNEVKQEAIVLIDELVETATHKESTSSKYSHDWLDNDGKNDWDYWKIIIQEKNKTVWEATLNIANTTNGEKILYDIYPIEMVEQAVTSATSTTKKNIPQISPSVKSENKKSVSGTRVEDSGGNALTKRQQEYFENSKVRDKNGNLLVMYQGSKENFTVFDRKKSSYGNLYGRGFYFTDSISHANQYGNARAYYLNIEHPVSTTETTITREQFRKFLEAVAENEDYGLENYGYGSTVKSVLESTYGKSDFLMLNDVSQTAIGDLVEAVELFNKINGTDYDGIILDTETVTFNSEQAKLTTNENPTSNPDIRKSVAGTRVSEESTDGSFDEEYEDFSNHPAIAGSNTGGVSFMDILSEETKVKAEAARKERKASVKTGNAVGKKSSSTAGKVENKVESKQPHSRFMTAPNLEQETPSNPDIRKTGSGTQESGTRVEDNLSVSDADTSVYTREASREDKSDYNQFLNDNGGGLHAFRPAKEKGWLSQQWITNRSEGNEEIAKSLNKISDIISNDFGVPINNRSFSDENVAGSFNLTAEAIHTRAKNDIITLSHEVGHLLDKKLKLQKLDGIDELTANFDRTLAALGYGEKSRKAEAVGEFVRMYLTNKEVAKVFCPEYFEAFESAIKKSDYKKAVEKLSGAVNAYLSAKTSERIDLAISDKTKEKSIRNNLAEKKNKFPELWNKFQYEFVDRYYAIGRAQGKVYAKNPQGKYDAHTLATNSLNSAARSAYILTKSFVTIEGEEIGKSFIDCLEPIANKKAGIRKKNISELNRYLVLKHALEWIDPKTEGAHKKRVFADESLENPEVLKAEIEKIEKDLPRVKEAAENIYQYIRNLKKYWGIDAGLMTQELSDKLDKMYPNYVPFFREGDTKTITGARTNLANQRAPILEATGGEGMIVNPLESIIGLTNKYVKTASRNMAMQAIAHMADNVGGTGFIIERASGEQQSALEGNEILEEKADAPEASPEELRSITTKEDVWTKATKNGKGFASVLIDGEKVWYQINDEQLFNAVADMEPKRLNAFLRGCNVVLNVKRSLITSNNPLFAATNAVRDAITAYNNIDINNPFSYLRAYFTALYHVIRKDPNYKRWCAMGGGHSSELSANMDAVKRELGKAMRNPKAKAFSWIIHPIQTIASVNDAIESTPRLMAFEHEMKKSGDVHKAINKADDITTNFKRGGRTAKNLNNMFMFSNAAIQGLDRTIRSFTKNETKHGLRNRIIKYSVVATLATVLQMAINRRDEERKEDYKNLSSYMKRSNYVISIGGGKFLRIPTAREQDMLRVIIADAVNYAFGDKEAFEGLLGFAVDTLWPWYVELPQNTDGKSILDIMTEMFINTARNTPFGFLTDFAANYDFTGKPIVSSKYDDVPRKEQYDERTSKLAVWLGKLTNESPLKIDYIINSNFGILGTINKSLFPMDKSQKDKTIGFISRWVADSYYSTDVLDKVYSKNEAAKMKFQGDGSGKNLAEYKKTSMAADFITQYNKAVKALPEEEKRDARKRLLDIINNWGNGKSASEEELIRLYDSIGEDMFITAPKLSISTTTGKRDMTADEYVELVEKYTAGYEALFAEVIASEKYKNADDYTKVKLLKDADSYALNSAKAEIFPDFEMPEWQAEIFEGKETASEAFFGRVEADAFDSAKKEWRKQNFNFDESKYSEAEISSMNEFEESAAAFYMSHEMGISYDEGKYRRVQVYHDYLSDDMTIEEYASIMAYARKVAALSDGKDSMTKKELMATLDNTGYSREVKGALFEGIANKGWNNPYSGGKTGDGTRFPVLTTPPEDGEKEELLLNSKESEKTTPKDENGKTEDKAEDKAEDKNNKPVTVNRAPKKSGNKKTSARTYTTTDTSNSVKTPPPQTKVTVKYNPNNYTTKQVSRFKQVESDANSYYNSPRLESYSGSSLRHMNVYETRLKSYIDIDTYAKIRAEVFGDKDSVTANELQTYIDNLDYDTEVKEALFEAIGEEGWENPYKE